MNFIQLSNTIQQTHTLLVKQASKSVNVLLTLRNLLIGYWLEEYELSGVDRAAYGSYLMENLAKNLEENAVPSCSARRLWAYRQFYQRYGNILPTVSVELKAALIMDDSAIINQILPTLSAECLSVSREKGISSIPRLPTKTLLNHLSFSHFAELIPIEDELKRSFYEIECVRGQWSARELRRQIGSQYYERSGLSNNKEALSKLVRKEAQLLNPQDFIQDPYVFEFLGLKPKEVMHENELRDALLTKIQDFLLEMGKGFCFEARNKRILIGDEYFFVDLVCYHRILKCHVLIELKNAHFNHSHISQLNTYLSYFKKHEMTIGDNPPIGLLLCAEKNDALVEYALDNLQNNVFVSQYQLALPSKTEMKLFLEKVLAQAIDELDENKNQ